MANLALVQTFTHSRYSILHPYSWFGSSDWRVVSPDGALVIYGKMPPDLREQWSIYGDESMTSPLFHFAPRERPYNAGNVPISELFKKDPKVTRDFTCDVLDARTREKLGVLRSQRAASMFSHDGPRSEWELLDASDQPVGLFKEDDTAVLGFIRLFVMRRWHGELGGVEVAQVRERFRFFDDEFELDVSMAPGKIDRRLALASVTFMLIALGCRIGEGKRP